MSPLAVLMGDRINGVFLIRKCMAVLPGQKKAAVRRGSTVILTL